MPGARRYGETTLLRRVLGIADGIVDGDKPRLIDLMLEPWLEARGLTRQPVGDSQRFG